VKVGAKANLQRLSTLRGATVVTATLPNNRKVKLRLSPELATQREISVLRAEENRNNATTSKALKANSAAITNLAKLQARSSKTLADQIAKGDTALSARLSQAETAIAARITKVDKDHQDAMKKQETEILRKTRRALRHQRSRQMWDSVLLASSMPLFAAYGTSGDLFHKNNLILTGLLGGLLFGDEFLSKGLGRKRGDAWNKSADVWSYVAPAINVGAAWFLFKDDQHERFLSGVTTLSSGTATIQLGSEHGLVKEAELVLTGQPVLVSVVSNGDSVTEIVGSVTGTTLTITAISSGEGQASPTVAFVIDTKKNS
jgi:hypothetical protein